VSAESPRTDTSARITAATFALLADRGLAGITMSAIAIEAGIARQTLYNRFPDVDSILAAAMAEHHQADLEALAAMLATVPTATGRLDHLVRHTTVNAAEHGTLPVLHEGLSPAAQHAAHDYQARIRQMIQDVLSLGQQSGELDPTYDPDQQSVLVHHLLHGAAELAASRPDDVAQITDATIGLLRAVTHPAR